MSLHDYVFLSLNSYFFGSFEVKTYCNLEFLRVRLLPVNQSKFAHINSNEINEGKKTTIKVEEGHA